MNYRDYQMLEEKYCDELQEFADQELTMSNLEIIHKLTDTIKNIKKILSMDDMGGRYSRYEGNVNTTNSMRRGMSRNYSYDSDMGMAESHRRYSRDDDSIHQLQKLLNDNRLSVEEKKSLRRMIEEAKGEA